MNPFQLSSLRRRGEARRPLEQDLPASRMVRLHADLTALAADLDRGGWGTVSIVHTPDRLQVSSQSSTESITPLLASALLADLERTLKAAAQVRAKLPPAWRETLLG